MSAIAGAPAFDGWLDDFFASYYRNRPVNATFIGQHEYDHLLPDASEAGLDRLRSETNSLLQRLHALQNESLSPVQRIDRSLAEGFLEVTRWELDSPQFVHGNPSHYTGEAIFGVISLFLRPFAPLADRAESAIARMDAIPTYLSQARERLRAAPAEWTARALRECAGAQSFFGTGIDILSQNPELPAEKLRAAGDRALSAFASFETGLRGELGRSPSGGYACGPQTLDLVIRRSHHLELSAEEIERRAENVMAESMAHLRDHARDFGAASPEEALAGLQALHPSTAGYYDAYGDVWRAARTAAIDRDLLTWPDFPIAFRPQPSWARAAAPSLYFLFYRSPTPFDVEVPMEHLVTPIERDMPPEEQERRLRATNDSVIKLNHVVHHAGIGHHVQNWHAMHCESRVGRIAATDCASRIAMQCGGTMAEGWACYATDLMDEIGFLTPLESYAERQGHLRMAARAVADVRLHQGRWTIDDAAAFYHGGALMSPEAARAEAVKNTLFPGSALMYLMGSQRIHDLRREQERALGPAFDLTSFHDRFLSFGSIPVSLAAEAMKREAVHAE